MTAIATMTVTPPLRLIATMTVTQETPRWKMTIQMATQTEWTEGELVSDSLVALTLLLSLLRVYHP